MTYRISSELAYEKLPGGSAGQFVTPDLTVCGHLWLY